MRRTWSGNAAAMVLLNSWRSASSVTSPPTRLPMYTCRCEWEPHMYYQHVTR